MKKRRGRRSGAELSVVTTLVPRERPRPPAELTAEQRTLWDALLACLPADWLPKEGGALLAQFCRHITAAKRIAAMLDACDVDDSRAFDRLLRAQHRESMALASLASKLRFSPSSRRSPDRAGREARDEPTGRRPWE